MSTKLSSMTSFPLFEGRKELLFVCPVIPDTFEFCPVPVIFPYLNQDEPIPICMITNLVDVDFFIADRTRDIPHKSPQRKR